MPDNERLDPYTPTGEPITVRSHLPFRSVFVPVVPCVFDGTLSLLELVAKLQYYVNKAIEGVNNNHTDIVNLAAYVNTLKEYIDTQDAATLAAAKAYADGLEAAVRLYIDTQDAAMLVAAMAYADGLDAAMKVYVDQQDASTLAAAKSYTDAGLALKQDLLTFDAEPTADSQNPARSGGIYSQISAVAGRMPYMVTAVLNNGTVTCSETYSNIANRLQTHSATTIVILTDEGTNSKEIYYMTSVTTNHIDFTATSSGHTLTVDSTNIWSYNV